MLYEVDDDNIPIVDSRTQGLVIMKFGAPWCVPCKTIDVMLPELAKELEVPIWKIDVDKSPTMASQFGIMTVPTIILMENGVAVKTRTGSCTKAQMLEFLKDYL